MKNTFLIGLICLFLAGCGSGDPGDTSTKDISTEDKPAPIINSNISAFAALKKDGSVVTWGSSWGGDSSAVAGELTDVSVIYPAGDTFAALKKDGSVVTWGNSRRGGDSSSVANELTDIRVIYSTDSAFAALKKTAR